MRKKIVNPKKTTIMTPKIQVNAEHPTTLIDYRGELVPVDNQMLPLLKILWGAGVDTLFCCQGDDPKFPSKYGANTGYIMATRETFPILYELLGLTDWEYVNRALPSTYNRDARGLKRIVCDSIPVEMFSAALGISVHFGNPDLLSLYEFVCKKVKEYV